MLGPEQSLIYSGHEAGNTNGTQIFASHEAYTNQWDSRVTCGQIKLPTNSKQQLPRVLLAAILLKQAARDAFDRVGMARS